MSETKGKKGKREREAKHRWGIKEGRMNYYCTRLLRFPFSSVYGFSFFSFFIDREKV